MFLAKTQNSIRFSSLIGEETAAMEGAMMDAAEEDTVGGGGGTAVGERGSPEGLPAVAKRLRKCLYRW